MMAEIRLLTLAAAGSMLFDVVLVAHSADQCYYLASLRSPAASDRIVR